MGSKEVHPKRNAITSPNVIIHLSPFIHYSFDLIKTILHVCVCERERWG